MAYYVYILQSLADESYFIGSTNNLEDRFQRHNQGRSKFTKTKRPWKLFFYEEHPDRSSAMKREYAIKHRKSKDHITKLIENFRSG